MIKGIDACHCRPQLANYLMMNLRGGDGYNRRCPIIHVYTRSKN